MRKLRLTAVALFVPLFAFAIAGCGGTKLSEKTLTYTSQDTDNFGFADNPPKSTAKGEPRLSNGDVLTFTANYVDSSKKKVGRLDATCTVTEGHGGFEKSFSSCLGTATLPGGTLVLSVGGRTPGNTTKGSIIGGTGEYDGATGNFTTEPVKGHADRETDTFKFFVPKK